MVTLNEENPMINRETTFKIVVVIYGICGIVSGILLLAKVN